MPDDAMKFHHPGRVVRLVEPVEIERTPELARVHAHRSLRAVVAPELAHVAAVAALVGGAERIGHARGSKGKQHEAERRRKHPESCRAKLEHYEARCRGVDCRARNQRDARAELRQQHEPANERAGDGASNVERVEPAHTPSR